MTVLELINKLLHLPPEYIVVDDDWLEILDVQRCDSVKEVQLYRDYLD
jgi:hypothetical protein